MRNNNYIAIAVGICVFGVFAILVALSSVTSNGPDVGGEKPAAALDKVYGSVRLPEAISRFQADGANGLITIEPGKQAKQLPAGRYRIRFWKTERKDEEGNTWVLTGQRLGNRGVFDVNDTAVADLDIGEPVICTLTVRKEQATHYFRHVLQGRLGEEIELTRNGMRPQPPKLHTKNKDGAYEHTFSFEYG